MENPSLRERRWWRRPPVRLSGRALMLLVLVPAGGLGWIVLHARLQRASLVGKEAADWEAKDVDGKVHRLADYRGRVVVMDFWYRRCGWCLTAMPQVNRLSEVFHDQPVSVLGMSIDEDEKDARAVIEAMGLRFPTIRAMALPDKFGVQAYPTLVVVDPRGRIREIHVGYSPRLFDDISRLIRELLAE